MSKKIKSKTVKDERIFIRFSITPADAEKLDRACKLDERSRADFARISTIRFANEIVSKYGSGEVISLVHSALSQVKTLEELDESKKDES